MFKLVISLQYKLFALKTAYPKPNKDRATEITQVLYYIYFIQILIQKYKSSAFDLLFVGVHMYILNFENSHLTR